MTVGALKPALAAKMGLWTPAFLPCLCRCPIFGSTRHGDANLLIHMRARRLNKELRTDCRYLVLFLKFIASVVPTIQYDYTMSVGGD